MGGKPSPSGFLRKLQRGLPLSQKGEVPAIKKKIKQALLVLAPFALLALALTVLFKDSWQQILIQSKSINALWFTAGLAADPAAFA